MDYMPPAYIQRIGDPRWARYVVKDGVGQYFTGSGWSDNPSQAVLFYSEADALAARIRHCSAGDFVRDTFVAGIVVVVASDQWTTEELVEHLKRYGKFTLRKSREQRGVVVEFVWDDLRRVE